MEDRPSHEHSTSGQRPKIRDAAAELGHEAWRVARPQSVERSVRDDPEELIGKDAGRRRR
jgi:hypothetical protein